MAQLLKFFPLVAENWQNKNNKTSSRGKQQQQNFILSQEYKLKCHKKYTDSMYTQTGNFNNKLSRHFL